MKTTVEKQKKRAYNNKLKFGITIIQKKLDSANARCEDRNTDSKFAQEAITRISSAQCGLPYSEKGNALKLHRARILICDHDNLRDRQFITALTVSVDALQSLIDQ